MIYYGSVKQPADRLKSLSGPVLGHFGLQDKFINEEMVAGFEKAMEEAAEEAARVEAEAAQKTAEQSENGNDQTGGAENADATTDKEKTST